ncbi:MAG TPA: FtsX-like permease family protein, partial [Bryobacteraceae bacterium]|nr:FtsX-like permease family protein [Bryobacteraceae bacterium]
QALLRLAPTGLIDPASIHMDTATLAFLAAVSIVTGVIFGIAPALATARLDPNDGLKESGRGVVRGSSAGRNALVIVEFALALVLLMGAGLLIRSFARLVQVNPGFRAANLLTLRYEPSAFHPDSQKSASLYERLETRLRSLPGVETIAATNALPLTAERANVTRFIVPGSTLMRPDLFPSAQQHLITPDYFRALGIALRGRTYNARDLDQPLVVVNETMARTFWPGEDAVGKRFILGTSVANPAWFTVIGVAANVKQSGLDAERTNDFYFLDYGPRFLILRTASDPLLLSGAVRREIQALDPSAPVSDFRSMEQVLEASTGPRRFSTLLLSIFAAVALTLAVIGIYGILSWSVAQRTQEIGIRMAIGADARGILRLILARGLKLSLIGLAIGLAATFALTRFLSTQLFEISAHDPWVLTGVSLLMLAVTTAACYIPAHRATRVDPMNALRCE